MNINKVNQNTTFSSVRILGSSVNETKQIVAKIVDRMQSDGEMAFFKDIVGRQGNNPYTDILILNKKDGLSVKVVDKNGNLLYEPANVRLSHFNIDIAKRQIAPIRKSEIAGLNRFPVYLPIKFPNARNLKPVMTYLSDSKYFCLLEEILPKFREFVYADKFSSDIVEKMMFLK